MEVEQDLSKFGRWDFLNMFRRMSPRAVLNFCQVNNRAAAVCRDEEIFKDLLKYHYPDDLQPYHLENPKSSYIQLTESYNYVYITRVQYATETCFLPVTGQLEFVGGSATNVWWKNEIVFTLHKLSNLDSRYIISEANEKLSLGQEFWVSIISDGNNDGSGQLNAGQQLFQSKEDAVRDSWNVYGKIAARLITRRNACRYIWEYKADDIQTATELLKVDMKFSDQGVDDFDAYSREFQTSNCIHIKIPSDIDVLRLLTDEEATDYGYSLEDEDDNEPPPIEFNSSKPPTAPLIFAVVKVVVSDLAPIEYESVEDVLEDYSD